MWTLDPIDGTKGFLRGEQYAVCLALLVDAKVQVGIMGCPNLPLDASKPDGPKGCLFIAVRGHGAEQVCKPVEFTIRSFNLKNQPLSHIAYPYEFLAHSSPNPTIHPRNTQSS